jgi:hypothetical protein
VFLSWVYGVVVRRDPPTTPTVRVEKLRGHTLPRHESTSTRPASNIGTVISTPSLGREDQREDGTLGYADVVLDASYCSKCAPAADALFKERRGQGASLCSAVGVVLCVSVRT